MNVIDLLILDNEKYKKHFRKNKLFKVKFDSTLRKNKFLKHFRIWSDEFQKMVLARVVFSETKEFKQLAWEHLTDEFGHNIELSQNLENDKETTDSIFEALGSWFTLKMMTLGDSERAVLVHLVIESCATIFYEKLGSIFCNHKTSQHFKTHMQLDPEHEQMGIDLLKQININDISLLIIQKKGWDMIDALFTRLAEITTVPDNV
ncbi:hypothetical protein [Rickettsia typhi]|uniref:Iron-containing redox enzyme family protein n=2 Tax=Rickettsia typhi TaxID=785 RepID=Q68WE6_RICTY|nr:hypothetical protein [Rickettsia typhi]AAU04046.1 rickettsial conserved hypothetical protein [Rickettsia typhi str. Wilmington]AFE54425.1 hypothetical protein RTTH1527_02800 [Rickettsia typhi str. TH1527]AFE55263.1 hypothetical protein RTB9991CWPP_02800 [Rickettsia typhi str. B9991CWPP]